MIMTNNYMFPSLDHIIDILAAGGDLNTGIFSAPSLS